MTGRIAAPYSWPPAAVELLTKAWCEDGKSAEEIAREINAKLGAGVTRNAVIGKATRLCLPSRDTPASTVSYHASKRSRNAKAAAHIRWNGSITGSKTVWRPGIDPKPAFLSKISEK